MTTSENKLVVSAIENGTVLDHIAADSIFKVCELLGLYSSENQITIGCNLQSRSLGRKGIIKVADRFFLDDEINRIALVAPNATINVIKGFKVVEKKTIRIPDEVIGIARCSNPLCITNHQPVTTRFSSIEVRGITKLHCHYCEKDTDLNNLVLSVNK